MESIALQMLYQLNELKACRHEIAHLRICNQDSDS